MFPNPSDRTLPPIVVSETDELRLTNLATAAVLLHRSLDAADTLLAEMDRAQVVQDCLMPGNVVRMNSVVECEIDGTSRRTVQLVPTTPISARARSQS